jgi:hypothetical protein
MAVRMGEEHMMLHMMVFLMEGKRSVLTLVEVCRGESTECNLGKAIAGSYYANTINAFCLWMPLQLISMDLAAFPLGTVFNHILPHV